MRKRYCLDFSSFSLGILKTKSSSGSEVYLTVLLASMCTIHWHLQYSARLSCWTQSCILKWPCLLRRTYSCSKTNTSKGIRSDLKQEWNGQQEVPRIRNVIKGMVFKMDDLITCHYCFILVVSWWWIYISINLQVSNATKTQLTTLLLLQMHYASMYIP